VNAPQKRQPIPFGNYLLLDRVNIGGMAEVWRAKSFGAGGFERIVAIKRILPNIAEDEEFITMFIDEAKITVQLTHANIAQIYELDNKVGSYYIAMEYVSGKDMRAVFDRCRKRGEPAPIPLSCYAIAQCCEGLDYAHRAKDKQGRDMGIVHRDVSPQNALISYDGEVKVIDFGIAKAAGKATKTQAGILKGKFGYMSPEQIRGLPLDGRSDIFAIGVCLYEMLTGERLFVGDSDFSVLEKVRKVEVLPPSHFNRKIPEALEKIVMKALAKDVDDRYQYASELAEDLRAFMYSTNNGYTRKDLAAFMRATFAEDYEKEKARLAEYAEIKAPEGMLAAMEMTFGVGQVPAGGGVAAQASAVTSVPTMVPPNAPPLVPPTAPGLPPISRPSAPPGGRTSSVPSIPRLTAVAPMLTNGKEEHESTVLAESGGALDEPDTGPAELRQDATRALNIRNRPSPTADTAQEIATDPGRPALARPGPPVVGPPVLTSEPRRPTRGVPAVPPPAVGPPIVSDTAPTLNAVSLKPQKLPPLELPSPQGPAAPQAPNTRLILGLAGIAAFVVVGILAIVLLKPPATGLLLISVPDTLADKASVTIDTQPLVDDNGKPVREFPHIISVKEGPRTVMVKAPGYEPAVEVVEVRSGGAPAEFNWQPKKKAAPAP
jgi:hypothetical protein